MKMIRILYFLVLVGLPFGGSAAVFLVNETAIDSPDTNPGNGVCDAINGQFGAQCTLRAAVMEANANPGPDSILFAEGGAAITLTIDPEGGNDAASGDLNITGSLIIFGSVAQPGLRPTITAHHGDRIFRVQADDVSITGLRLSDGETDTHGGAIRVDSSEDVLIDAVRFFNNTAVQGGGAVGSFFSSVEITRADFEDNEATGFGSSIFLSAGDMNLDQSSVRFGQSPGPAEDRVAINVGAGASLNIVNSTVASNDGHGVRVANGTLQTRNATIANNTGEGIYFIRTVDQTLFMRNTALIDGCIAIGSPAAATLSTNGYNLSVAEGCDLELGESNTIHPDPGLGPLQLGLDDFTAYHALPAGSLLRDQGHPLTGGIGCRTVDQRNVERPIDGNGNGVPRCDIGAIEASPVLLGDEIFSDRFSAE